MISDRVLDLSKGEADVAIRSGHPQDEALIGRKIGDAPWAVYGSSSYIEHHGAPGCVEDVGQHLIVTCEPCTAEDPVTQWVRSVAPNARIAVRCDSSSALVQAVKSGAGLAPMMAYQEDNALVRVIDIFDITTPFYLLMHHDMQRTPRVAGLRRFRCIRNQGVSRTGGRPFLDEAPSPAGDGIPIGRCAATAKDLAFGRQVPDLVRPKLGPTTLSRSDCPATGRSDLSTVAPSDTKFVVWVEAVGAGGCSPIGCPTPRRPPPHQW
jgi:hypothetical protein